MKVLFVFNHPAPYKVRLFNELTKLVDLFVIFERNKASNRPQDFYNCNTYSFNHKFLKRGAFGEENSNTSELKTYIKKHHYEYDLIIMNGYSTLSEMKAIQYMKKMKIPFVLYINGGVVKKESNLKFKVKKHFIASAFKYISPCDEADEYLLHYEVKKDNILHYTYSTFYSNEVLSNPLTNEEKLKIRKEFDLPDGELFITASQFIERKNIEQLLELFKDLPNKQLAIYGEGPLKECYLEFIKEHDMKNVIVRDFLKREELFKVMKSADCFITLSKEDIYGHTTNEAMANGLPVISSDTVVSSRHLIKNGINGYLVSLTNTNSIVDAINSVTPSMSLEAIRTANENTIEKTAEAHSIIFKEVLK